MGDLQTNAKPDSSARQPSGVVAQPQAIGAKRPTPAARIDWEQLQSLSGQEFLEALRASGFSDSLAKNIVLGRIHARYSNDLEQLRADGASDESIGARFKVFQHEIESIIGMPWYLERRHGFFEKTMEHAAMDGLLLGHVFPESWEQADRILGSFPPRWAALGDQRTALNATLSDLRAAIGDAAFEEFQLRAFSFQFFDVLRPHRVFPADFSDAESRAALRAVMPQDFAPPLYGTRSDLIDARRLMLESLPEIRSSVGDEKFGSFLKLNQAIFKRTTLSDLTSLEAIKLYEMRQLVQHEAQYLRAEWGLPAFPDDVAMHIFLWLEEAMFEVLGPARYPAYAGRSSEWIDEGGR